MIDLPARGVTRLLARPLPGRAGIGALLTRCLTDMATDSTAYGPADRARLGTVTTDLLTALLAHHLDADTAVSENSLQRSLLMRIEGRSSANNFPAHS
ncbi:hypothetical protein ACFV3R_32215 [Streptomyces sp. NPDC059740]|uniref:hypothetical protein n=1 Tax=Streptomyces sp. NPDC059740 TaxID=3346926 RepID=UPI003665D5E3